VRHEAVTLPDGTIDVDIDPLSTKLVNIEDLNKKAADLLSMHGLNGSVFWKKAPRLDQLKMNTAVTVPLSREQQDLLMNTVLERSRFYATGGEHLNSDDNFIAQERKERRTKYEILKEKKDKYEDYQVTKTEAQRVIQDCRNSKNKYAYNDGEATDIKILDLKILYK